MLLRKFLRGSIDPGKEVITLTHAHTHASRFRTFWNASSGSRGGTPLNGPICLLVLEFATFIAKDYIQHSSGSQKPLWG